MTAIYVVIPVKGKQELTHSILDQLLLQEGFAGIFLYDNAADTDDALTETEGWDGRIHVIPAAGMSIHEMWNAGIAEALAADPDCFIAILNNDLELGPDFLANMAAGLRLDPLIGAVSGNYDGRTADGIVQQVHGICAGRYDGTGGLAGFAFMIRSELVDAMGGQVFDEDLKWWYGDNLFCLEMERMGVIYGIALDAHVVHIDGGSKTSGTDPMNLHPEFRALTEIDRETFLAKSGLHV